MTLLTNAEEISDIAFGFMGSKALFAALHHGVFTCLADGPLSVEELGEATGLHPDRVQTLLTALASLGVVSTEDGRFANSPAAESFLVKGAKYDFGDYLRLQVDRWTRSRMPSRTNCRTMPPVPTPTGSPTRSRPSFILAASMPAPLAPRGVWRS